MSVAPETTAAVDATISSRHSVRAFLPTPVPRAMIEDILRLAARAPSGTNTQPWQVYVLTGAAKEALSRDMSMISMGFRHQDSSGNRRPRRSRGILR